MTPIVQIPPYSWHEDATDAPRRPREFERARAHVERGRSLLIVADRGMGRSHLAARLAAHAPLVSAQLPEADRTLRALLDDDTAKLIVVDDAHLLPTDTRARLRERITAGKPTVITLRSPRTGDASDEMLAPWRGLQAERLDLARMSDAEIHRVIAAAAAPATVDTLTVRAVTALSAGSPTRAHELIADAADGLSVLSLATPDPWSLPTITARMAELLAGEHPRDVDDDAATAAVIMSELGTVGRFQAAQLWNSAVIDRLVLARIVTKDAARSTMRADPITALALRTLRDLPDLDAERQRVGAALLEAWHNGLRLQHGAIAYAGAAAMRTHAPHDAVTRERTAVLLLEAASVASTRGFHDDAAQAAAMSLTLRDGVQGALATARAEIGVGDYARAAQVLASVHHAALDGRHTTEYAHTRVLVDLHRGVTDPLTTAVLSWLARSSDAGHRADAVVLEVWSGARALTSSTFADLRRVATDTTLPPTTRLWACLMLVFLLTEAGSHEELAAIVQLGRSLRETANASDAVTGRSLHGSARTLFVLFAGCASVIAGVAVDDLRIDLARLRDDATDPFAASTALDRLTVLFLTALHAIVRGDLTTADAELTAASHYADADSWPQVAGYIDLLRACLTRRRDGAKPTTHDLFTIIQAVPLPGFWGRFYAGIRTPGSNRETRRASWLATAIAYFALLPGGDPAPLRDGLTPSHRRLTAPRAVAMIAHIDAAASGDPEVLVAAAELLVQRDMVGHAILAYEQARRAFLALRRTARANDCARRAEDLSTNYGIADGALTERAGARASASLTARELEVSMHVADGFTNQEIAARLFLSVRTVESHVLQARAKLGAARREDIADRLQAP